LLTPRFNQTTVIDRLAQRVVSYSELICGFSPVAPLVKKTLRLLKNFGSQNLSAMTPLANPQKALYSFRAKPVQPPNHTTLGHSEDAQDIHLTTGAGINQLRDDEAKHPFITSAV
jgi:hypothetical protein